MPVSRFGSTGARAGWSMALALVACRSVPAVEPVPSTDPARDLTAVTALPLAPVPEDEDEDADAADALPEPPPLQAIVPLDLPFAADALAVRMVEDIGPVVLFPEEASEVRHRVAEALVGHGHVVVPVDELERIESAAAKGRLVLEDDRICRAPLTSDEVVDRYFSERSSARVEAGCYHACRVQVSVEHDQSIEDPAYSSAVVGQPHDPRAWARAAGHLEEGLVGIAVLGGFGASHPPPIMFGTPEGSGPWRAPPSGERLTALEPQVAGCAHPDPSVGFSYDVRALVAPSGKIARCTAKTSHSLARTADAECLCEGIRTLRYPAGPRGRRFRVEARDEGGFFLASFGQLQPGTEPWVRRLDESTARRVCTDAHPLEEPFDVTIVLTLALDGAVEKVEVFGEVTTMSSMKMASCFVRELTAVPFPCRPPGIDQLQVRLALPGSRG